MKSFKIMLATLALTTLSASVCAVPSQAASEDSYSASNTQSVKKQRSNSVTLSIVESRTQQPRLTGPNDSNQRVLLIAPTLVSQTDE